eukprot:902465_1
MESALCVAMSKKNTFISHPNDVHVRNEAKNNDDDDDDVEVIDFDPVMIAKLQIEISNAAFTDTLESQSNYNRFESEHWKAVEEKILRYVLLTRSFPRMPSRRYLSDTLMNRRYNHMQSSVRSIIACCRSFQFIGDGTTKEHISRFLSLFHIARCIAFLLEIEQPKSLKSDDLFTSHSKLVDDVQSHGRNLHMPIYRISTSDNCYQMESFRVKCVTRYRCLPIGCLIHIIVNAGLKVEKCEGFMTQTIALARSLIKDIFGNYHVYNLMKDYLKRERVARPVCNNTLTWGKSGAQLLWLVKNGVMIEAIQRVKPEHFTNDMADYIALNQESKMRCGLEYLEPIRLGISQLNFEGSNLADGLCVFYKLSIAFDYSPVVLHYEELNLELFDIAEEIADDDDDVRTLDLSHVDLLFDLKRYSIAKTFIPLAKASCVHGVLTFGGESFECIDHDVGDIIKDTSDADGHYVLIYQNGKTVVRDCMEHEFLCDSFSQYLNTKYYQHSYQSICAASFMVDIRFRSWPMQARHTVDARTYFLSVFGNRADDAWTIMSRFRNKYGRFGVGVFDTMGYSDHDLLMVDPSKCWLSITHTNDILLQAVATHAIDILYFKCDQAPIERVIKQYNHVTSHNRQAKGITIKDKEVILRHNERILREHYQYEY